VTLNAGQYRALCDACDRVLLAPDATIERVAVPWLHVIREHPVFLQSYADEARGSSRAGARFGRTLRGKAIKWRQFWRAARSDGLPWHTAGALPDSVEVLFVSHLLNAAQAGQAEDFYFGTLADELRERGRPAALALLNHAGQRSRDLASQWPRDAAPRVVLSASLAPAEERALRRRLLTESRRLEQLARGTESGLERSVWSRAAAEAQSGAALATLRISEQVGALVAKLRPSAIVVTHEGHAWERVVFAAARRSRPGIRCIGYQHAALFKLQHAVRRNLLPAYNPDQIVAAGNVAAAQLASAPRLAGVSVSVLGSSRAAKARAAASQVAAPATAARADKAFTCLVLPEGIPAECHLLFELSLECARACPDMSFIWRLHPIVSFESLLKRNVKLRNRPPNVKLSTRAFADDAAGAGWALYRGSTAVIQAVAERVRPVYVQVPGEMTVDPLYELEGFRERIATAADFVRIVRGARERGERDDGAADAARAYCAAMYVPFNVDVLLEAIRTAAPSEVAGSAMRLHGIAS
jgi:hypothetical protein